MTFDANTLVHKFVVAFRDSRVLIRCDSEKVGKKVGSAILRGMVYGRPLEMAVWEELPIGMPFQITDGEVRIWSMTP
jgi:hypothetical protein